MDVAQVYSLGAADSVITPSGSFTTWDAFFGNSDPECAISSCTISDAGDCGSGTFAGSSDVIFEAASPWGMTATKSKIPGYNYSICIQCTNG